MSALTNELYEPSARFINIDPDMARKWLTKNVNNRPLRLNSVVKISSDIINGRWQVNGATITFNDKGELIDGQHRLSAIVAANMTVMSLVVTEISPDAMPTIDMGDVRTVAHILALRGIPSSTRVAALAMIYMKYLRYPEIQWNNKGETSRVELANFGTEISDLLISGTNTANGLKRIGLCNSSYGLLYVLVHTESENKHLWDEFHDGVTTGAGLWEGDPRLALRNFTMRRSFKAGAWDQQALAAICIKTWNKWLMGEKMKMVGFRREELPMPRVL